MENIKGQFIFNCPFAFYLDFLATSTFNFLLHRVLSMQLSIKSPTRSDAISTKVNLSSISILPTWLLFILALLSKNSNKILGLVPYLYDLHLKIF